MMEALRSFHFLYPWWLLTLLALPIIVWLGARRNASQQALQRIVDPELLPYLVSGQARHIRLPMGLWVLGWTLAALAMAGPTWSRVAQPMFSNRAAQVVAVSLSRDMLASDVPPNRMERARYKAHDLLSANRDGMNALIGYAGESFVVAPLTSDFHSLASLLDAMSPDVMPVEGDNAAQAIRQGVQLIRDAKLSGGSIVLITDNANAAADAAARRAAAAGVRVSVLGMGTSQGAPVPEGESGFLHDDQGHIVVARRDDNALRALARAGSGRYVAMTDNGSDVITLHAALRPPHGANVVHGVTSDVWQDRGPWLLIPLLLVAAMVFRRGWVLLVPLVLLPVLPTSAQASGWPDWWYRPDQQAAMALKQGHAAEAQRLAQDPAWRGAAAYRAKDYASAVQALEQAKGADAHYNLGNALAELGRYPDAIKAYDRALQLDPHNGDARFNRKVVEEAMRKQQQQAASSQQPKQGEQSAPSKPHGQGGQSSGQQQQARQDDENKEGQEQNAQKKTDGHAGSSAKENAQNATHPDAQQSRDAQGSLNKPRTQDASRQSPAPASGEEKAQTAKAQQALQSQMDKALAGAQEKAASAPAHELGAEDNSDPLSKLPENIRRDLHRVPDDPGALLRRKFELEYRERMGAQPVEGDQP